VEAKLVKQITLTLALGALLVIAGPAVAQQPETGPKSAPKSEHPMRNGETGTRGPSGGSPETGYHGPRDVTKDKEPGKKKSSEELKKSGQVPDTKPKKN
jgi:hypothetical protein